SARAVTAPAAISVDMRFLMCLPFLPPWTAGVDVGCAQEKLRARSRAQLHPRGLDGESGRPLVALTEHGDLGVLVERFALLPPLAEHASEHRLACAERCGEAVEEDGENHDGKSGLESESDIDAVQ